MYNHWSLYLIDDQHMPGCGTEIAVKGCGVSKVLISRVLGRHYGPVFFQPISEPNDLLSRGATVLASPLCYLHFAVLARSTAISEGLRTLRDFAIGDTKGGQSRMKQIPDLLILMATCYLLIGLGPLINLADLLGGVLNTEVEETESHIKR